jgi:hypothetical protein
VFATVGVGVAVGVGVRVAVTVGALVATVTGVALATPAGVSANAVTGIAGAIELSTIAALSATRGSGKAARRSARVIERSVLLDTRSSDERGVTVRRTPSHVTSTARVTMIRSTLKSLLLKAVR